MRISIDLTYEEAREQVKQELGHDLSEEQWDRLVLNHREHTGG